MKVRHGFISNSSSSSFIVAFKKNPENAQELKIMLFGEKEFFPEPFPEYCSLTTHLSTIYVSERVFADMEKGPVSVEFALETTKSGYLFYGPDTNSFHGPDGEWDFDAWLVEVEKYAEKTFKEFIKKNEGCVLYEFEYSDNKSPEESAFEHCGLFKNMPHLAISNH